MLTMFGCAGMIGAVFMIFGLIGSMFASDATILERVAMGVATGGMAFVASLILMSRDMGRAKATHRRVKRILQLRDDQNDQDYLLHFPRAHREIAVAVRNAVAAYFDVPPAKIFAGDSPGHDYQTEWLTPGFHMFVVGHVAEAHEVKLEQWTYRQECEQEMVELVREIRRIMQGGTEQKQS